MIPENVQIIPIVCSWFIGLYQLVGFLMNGSMSSRTVYADLFDIRNLL